MYFLMRNLYVICFHHLPIQKTFKRMPAQQSRIFPDKLLKQLTDAADDPVNITPGERARIAMEALLHAVDILDSTSHPVMRQTPVTLEHELNAQRFDKALAQQLARLADIHARCADYFTITEEAAEEVALCVVTVKRMRA